MPESTTNAETQAVAADPRRYVVVARRYRPQAFDELIGQEHVAQALANAITSNRVGHAYLFTGARGVGKTSAARILAKSLNCEKGPATKPCNECDSCRSISAGDDIDVLEIDGASNRRIEESRQIIQNVGVRPSRSRNKIYIIDEVHMLTREAFNALLKTLEEPPEHVKFIFCTTEPTKIPITILSRCQRFDFAGIMTRSILKRLEQIASAEGVEADTDALEIIARRAAGSMRDSQSLLEQLLAFSTGRITVEAVHGMLGTAGEERLAAMAGALADRNPAAALTELDEAITSGVDAGLLVEQLFGYLRDCMASAVGCKPDAFLFTSPSAAEQVTKLAERWGLDTLLAVMQILDQTLGRMKYSTQGRILAELALVKISRLEQFEELSDLIGQLQSGAVAQPSGTPAPQRPAGPPMPPPVKKKSEPVAPSEDKYAEAPPAEEAASVPAIELTEQSAAEVWNAALSTLSGMFVEHAKQFETIAYTAPNRLTVSLKADLAFAKSICERPDNISRFEKAVSATAGRPIRVEFAVAKAAHAEAEPPQKSLPMRSQLQEVANNPFVRRATELFDARPVKVEDSNR